MPKSNTWINKYHYLAEFLITLLYYTVLVLKIVMRASDIYRNGNMNTMCFELLESTEQH